MADRKRKYATTEQGQDQIPAHVGLQNTAKRSCIQDTVTGTWKSTETGPDSRLEAEFQRLAKTLQEHGIEYRPGGLLAQIASKESEGKQVRSRKAAQTENDDCVIINVQPVRSPQPGFGSNITAGHHVKDRSENVNASNIKSEGHDMDPTDQPSERDALNDDELSKKYRKTPLPEPLKQKLNQIQTKVTHTTETEAQEKAQDSVVQDAQLADNLKSEREREDKSRLGLPTSMRNTTTRRSKTRPKPMHYLSIYAGLPADAPWNHAHLILDTDGNPSENLNLPEQDRVLPDMVVSAIYKHSEEEALDAFLNVDMLHEFWLLCQMPAASTNYSWSICRRGNLYR